MLVFMPNVEKIGIHCSCIGEKVGDIERLEGRETHVWMMKKKNFGAVGFYATLNE